jgi:hypothetical protein
MLQRPNPLANRRQQAAANNAFRSTVKKYLTLLIALPNLSFWLVPTGLCAGQPQIKVEQVLQTTQSWDSQPLHQLSHRATAGDGAQDNDPAQHRFALASSPDHQRWLRAIWTSYAGKKRYWRTHNSTGWTSGGGNCANNASWFHDR